MEPTSKTSGPIIDQIPASTTLEQPTANPRPRRRRITRTISIRVDTPGYKMLLTVLLAFGLLAAQAQVPDRPPTPPNVPTKPPVRPVDPENPVPPMVPQPPTKPTPQPVQRGWVLFTDQVGNDLGLEKDQLQRLRDVDMKYQKDYEALGNEPTTNLGYRSLTERRNTDVKGILTSEQYTRWNRLYNAMPSAQPTSPQPKAH